MRATRARTPDAQVNSETEPRAKTRAPTWRALAIGTALMAINVIWIVRVEYVAYTNSASTASLYTNSVLLLCVMYLVAARSGFQLQRTPEAPIPVRVTAVFRARQYLNWYCAVKTFLPVA